MEAIKKHITAAQVTAIMDFMKEHCDVATGLINAGVEKKGLEAQWHDLAVKLNSMGGAVKSIEQWKKTWSYLKWSNKKRGQHRTMKHSRPMRDPSGMSSSHKSAHPIQGIDDDNVVPAKKQFAAFDEELVSIEKAKLELERKYKVQKIEALCRIAAALENFANKS